MAKVEKRQIVSGEKSVNNSDRVNLPVSEEAWLRGLSDGHDEWEKLKQQEKTFQIAQKDFARKLNSKRKILQEMESEIDTMAKKIDLHSEKINTNNDLSLSPPKEKDFAF